GTLPPGRSLLPAHRPPFVIVSGNTASPGKGSARTGRPGRASPREALHRADGQSSRDDNLLGVRPPGPSPRDAVSINRFRVEQLPWPVLAERRRTMVNCNPNCNLAHDCWV